MPPSFDLCVLTDLVIADCNRARLAAARSVRSVWQLAADARLLVTNIIFNCLYYIYYYAILSIWYSCTKTTKFTWSLLKFYIHFA